MVVVCCASFRPLACKICAARDPSMRNIPSSRCSVSTLLCPSLSASSAAKSRIWRHSAVSGTSTEVGMRSRAVMRLSISVRISDAKSVSPRNRVISARSSRTSPSSMCSVSIEGLRTGLLRSAQRKSRAGLSLCNDQTWVAPEHATSGRAATLSARRRSVYVGGSRTAIGAGAVSQRRTLNRPVSSVSTH